MAGAAAGVKEARQRGRNESVWREKKKERKIESEKSKLSTAIRVTGNRIKVKGETMKGSRRRVEEEKVKKIQETKVKNR